MARSMLSEYNVSQFFWAKAINTACYCSKHLYCHPLKEKTPYELLNGRKPNIAYFWISGFKCYILKKGTRLGKFEEKCDEGFQLGYSTISKPYRVWNLASSTLEEVRDVEFDETKGSQDENENLEDVRAIQLSNAMKNMDVGELRPRLVIDEENDQVQVLSNSMCKLMQIKQVQVALMTMCKIKWLVHHLNPMIKQVQAIKFQYSNQLILQEIIHWTL
jgi:uncharacterized protein YifE (UPF0438 family)